jgi:hypothetical protein
MDAYYNWKVDGKRVSNHYNIFSTLTDLFNMELTTKQLFTLNELYNSGDESNQRVAAAMFQTIMLQNLKEKL